MTVHEWAESVNQTWHNAEPTAPLMPTIQDSIGNGNKERPAGTAVYHIYSAYLRFSWTEYELFSTWVETNLVLGTQPFVISAGTIWGGGNKIVRLVSADNRKWLEEEKTVETVKIKLTMTDDVY